MKQFEEIKFNIIYELKNIWIVTKFEYTQNI